MTSKNEKTPQFIAEVMFRGVNFRSPTIWRVSNHTPTKINLPVSPPDHMSGIEQQIISTIKTIRKDKLKEIVI